MEHYFLRVLLKSLLFVLLYNAFFAIESGDTSIIKYLLSKNVKIWVKNFESNEPIHIAAKENNPSLIDIFLRNSADINAENYSEFLNEPSGYTPLHTAVEKNNFEAVKYLLENGADVNKEDRGKLTALHLAILVENINTKILNLLLDNGADCNKIWYGCSPFTSAVIKNKIEVSNILSK